MRVSDEYHGAGTVPGPGLHASSSRSPWPAESALLCVSLVGTWRLTGLSATTRELIASTQTRARDSRSVSCLLLCQPDEVCAPHLPSRWPAIPMTHPVRCPCRPEGWHHLPVPAGLRVSPRTHSPCRRPPSTFQGLQLELKTAHVSSQPVQHKGPSLWSPHTFINGFIHLCS